MRVTRLSVCAAASALIGGCASTASGAVQYEIRLDDRDPHNVRLSVNNPPKVLRLATPSQTTNAQANSPICDGRALVEAAPAMWDVPERCKRVDWSVWIPAIHETYPIDIAAPKSTWDPEARLWLLTGSFPWLKSEGQADVGISIVARLRGKSVVTTASLPVDASIPVAIVIGHPVRTFVASGFTVQGFGHLPPPLADPWQRQLASILAAWRRDLLPPGSSPPSRMSYVWLPSSSAGESGLNASANSGSVLMQYRPAPGSEIGGQMLQVGILMIGAHEGFHSLGAVRGAPAWANESLATYFAYKAAKPYFDQEAVQLAEEFVSARADRSLLGLQQAFDVGDGSAYPKFYGKGARFWAAIERVLTTHPNESGRLSELIRQTEGLKGMDWSDGDQIGAYLDRFSDGRARKIARCFLVDAGCPSANDPI